jgi:hypothetical protein
MRVDIFWSKNYAYVLNKIIRLDDFLKIKNEVPL